MSELGDRDTEVAEKIAGVARTMQAAETRHDTWQRLVDRAVDVLPEFEHAAISLVHRDGRIDTVAATDDVCALVDSIQYETGEGPCLSAIREADMYVAEDLATERRWPAFSRRAVDEAGIRAMLCFRLFVQEDLLGALNFYNQTVSAFGGRSQAFGAVLAAHGAIAISAADEHDHAEQLERALESSREIGVAIGIVMAQSGTDRAGAFRMLSQASQRTNVRLREIAAHIVEATEAAEGRLRPGPAAVVSTTEPRPSPPGAPR